MHGENPAGQRHLGGLEDDGAGRRRRLVPAEVALPVAPSLSDECAVLPITVDRAVESLPPARGHQRRVAFLLGSVPVQKLNHR